MSIEWASIIYTTLAETAGWMFLCMAIDGFRSDPDRNPSWAAGVATLVVAALAACAGVVSIDGPQHVFSMLRGVAHSGVSQDELVFILLLACCIVYLVLVRRNAGVLPVRIVLVIGAAFGVALSYLNGRELPYAAYPARDTVLMPLSYLATAMPAGIAAYLAIAAKQKRDEKTIWFFALLLVVGGALSAILSAAFILHADTVNAVSIAAGSAAVSIWMLPSIMSGIVVIICGAAIMRKPSRAFALAILALVCALAGCILVRCAMYLASVTPHRASNNLSYKSNL